LDALQRNEHKERSGKVKWVFAPIIFGEDQNNAPIHHWVPDNDKDKVTPYKKFSVKIDLLKYSEIEYDQYLKDLDQTWTKQETDYLWELLDRYDLRFFVVHDAYDSQYGRSVEELKLRYYSICKKLCQERGDENNPLAQYTFDAEYEKLRKY